MPELPDVEAQRRLAQRHAVGATVDAVRCPVPEILRSTTPQGLGRALSGATIESAERQGKWLWLATSAANDLLAHFGMTGELHWHPEDEPVCEGDLVHLLLDGGVLAYHAIRKLGGVWVVRGEDERREVTGELGVDALEADGEVLRERLGDSTASLKSALMDQRLVAGIGNLLADELCWQVRLHPALSCPDVPDSAWEDLAEALSRVLAAGIAAGQVPAEEGFLTAVREEDDPRCPRCAAQLARSTIAGRTSRWCPQDQPDPRDGASH